MINESIKIPVEVMIILQILDIYVTPTMGETQKITDFITCYPLKNNVYLIPLTHEFYPEMQPKKHLLLLDMTTQEYVQFSSVFWRLDKPNSHKKIIKWEVYSENNSHNDFIKNSILEVQDITGINLELIASVNVYLQKS